MTNRRAALRILGSAAALGSGLPFRLAWSASDADFPDKAVQLIVPYAAGGPTDLIGRVLADGLTQNWPERVYVVNRPGASGDIGVQALLATPPDGYNLMLSASAGYVIYPALFATPPYDSVRDFTALSTIAYSDLVLVVRTDLPVTDLAQFVAYIKAHPGQVSYGSAGIGALNHVGGALFARSTGTDLQHIPYKGDAPVIVDLLNGNVTMSFLSSQLAIQQIQAGKLKPLAVTGAERMTALPDVPTMMEAGVRDFNLRAWNGLVGPAGMASDLVVKINQAIGVAMNRPEVKARLAGLGLVVQTSSPQAFADQLRSESARWRTFIKSAGIHITAQE
jgi:tripartite-type tricarboxylate transporter receptor subunit TctC